MAVAAPDDGSGELLTPGWVLLLLRVLSWGVVGAVIGMGQGVTYNTREDLRACTLGGLVGGLIGGGLFDPVSQFADFGAASTGRAIADVVVGAAIGGSMKLAQGALVANSGRRPTALLYVPGMDLMDTGDESPRRPGSADNGRQGNNDRGRQGDNDRGRIGAAAERCFGGQGATEVVARRSGGVSRCLG